VLESELASCAAALLARDARGLREVPAAFEADSLPVRAALVQALGRSAQREALDVLAELLGEEPRLEAAMLSEVGRLAAAPPFGERLRTEVRTRLSAQDFQVLREAALVVGRLRDDAATPQLVALLGHARAAVRDSAHAALRELTGLGFPNDAERWRAWLASEQAWFERSFGSVAYRLRSRDRRDVLAALAELVQHRYRRRELAAEAARLLDDVDHHVRRATCASLRTLGTCADLEPLIRCLDDENTAVAAEAHGALLALTGAELDASSAAWREALDAGSLRVR
jgi:HEAT repeat protein